MQAVDITGLNSRQIAHLESDPSNSMAVDSTGMGRPFAQPVIRVKGNNKNRALHAKYGDRIFDKGGKVVLSRIPKEDILKRLVRRKGDSRDNLLSQLGVSYVLNLYNSGAINKSDMKLSTKKELNRACCKFTGVTPKKSAEEKARAREALKKKKEKSRKHGSKLKREEKKIGPAKEQREIVAE